MPFAGAQTLTTDQSDYPPGALATLTGAGFEAGESVRLQVLHADEVPQDGQGHEPWFVVADASGGFVTTWTVCLDDCLGSLLRATADGVTSGLHAEILFTDSDCGSGVVTVAAGSPSTCISFLDFPSPVPDFWNVRQGSPYVMTISGVTECTGDSILVYARRSSTVAFCFVANRISSTNTGTGLVSDYAGAFTMPDNACATYPLFYKCNAAGACSSAGTYLAQGPSSGCDGVSLRAARFDANCVTLGSDNDCSSCCTPVLTCPSDRQVACGGDTSPSATGTATTGGTCNSIVSYSDSTTPGSCGGTSVILRTWTATGGDSCGNTASCVQTITVVDGTAPTIVCPPGATVDCGASTDPSNTGTASANDACSGIASLGFQDAVTPGDCSGTRTITRTWTAVDGCGNAASCVQTIQVVDTTPPAIQCLGDVTLGCSAPTDPANTGAATAEDDCSSVASITYQDAEAAHGCGEGRRITRTWTARDACGNQSTCVQLITLADASSPTITAPPSIEVRSMGACCMTIALGTPVAGDDCGTPVVTHDAPAEFCVGTTVVTWTATDACGNTQTATQSVTVLGGICAHVFYDANLDGDQDAGEANLANWPVQVTGPVTLSATTDGAGNVCFDAPAGTYTVSESLPIQANWAASTLTSVTVTIDGTNCSATVLFGNYCFSAPAGGFTLGFWSNKNGQRILSQNDPAWRAALNALNLRNANGSSYIVSTTASFANAYGSFRSWLLNANATNMAYMLSAQLAATTLDVQFGGAGLSDATTIVVPGGLRSVSGTCIVPLLSTVQPLTCGDLPLLSSTSMPGSGSCSCIYNDGLVTVGDLRSRAVCLLGAYANTTPSGLPRTYQAAVKDLLDLVNNNGEIGAAPCGGLRQYVRPTGDACPRTFP